MGVYYRKDRGRWQYRVCRRGKRHKGKLWKSREEAEREERDLLRVIDLPATALRTAAEAYLIDSSLKRSNSRYYGIKYNLARWILPYFGEATPLTDIKPAGVEAFITLHKARGVKNITIWHYIKDGRALFNWAIKKGLLPKDWENPFSNADLSSIKKRKTVKPPLDVAAVDVAASALSGKDRLYFDILRYCGLRKDEGNRLQIKDVVTRGDSVWLLVHGTKTDDSERLVPVPPVLQDALLRSIAGREPTEYICDYYGERQYDRRRMFERILEATGIKLKPKDLRDYLPSVLTDPVAAQQILGHTDLRTTSNFYIRVVHDRLLNAVKNVGEQNGGKMVAAIGESGPQSHIQDEAAPS